MKKALATIALMSASITAQAYVVGFIPSGISEVAQSQSIGWDMTSDQTFPGTLYPSLPSYFTLTNHGDFHFMLDEASMVGPSGLYAFPKGTNLSEGTLINYNSDWINNFVAYTDNFVPGCDIGSTCIYGVRFRLGGADHFGWVEFHEGTDTQSLLRWAYETQAGVGILAGDMGTVAVPPTPALAGLGLAAMGFAHRRRKAT
ncbi:MAG: hypothetical protein JNK97_15460 [Zoogloea sp.]|nr:hypothetical protein [Zoogloea sp.]